jgi:hypothetical protein
MTGKFRQTVVHRPANARVQDTEAAKAPASSDATPAPEADAVAGANTAPELSQDAQNALAEAKAREMAREIGGPKGPEPTRFGDWEHKGRCIDF